MLLQNVTKILSFWKIIWINYATNKALYIFQHIFHLILICIFMMLNDLVGLRGNISWKNI